MSRDHDVFKSYTTAPLFEIPLHRRIPTKFFKVYDGDTCRFMIEVEGKVQAFKARILHINTAEMKTKCPFEKRLAHIAKDRAKQLLHEKCGYVTCKGTDLYGRKLVEITINGQNYHDILLSENVALPYEGTRKFADIQLSDTDIYCASCQKDEKAKKNCLMWRRLQQAFDSI